MDLRTGTGRAGEILSGQLARNPKGLVLFSSTKVAHVKANLAGLDA